MVKQRRSFFVDDILHMVMPTHDNTISSNEISERKRKRSLTSDDEDKEAQVYVKEEASSKKFRSHVNQKSHHHEDHNDELKRSPILDVLGDDGIDDDSSLSDNSSSSGNNSGECNQIPLM
jgi:hypothetical protein